VSARTSPPDLYRPSRRLPLDMDVPAWVGPLAEDGIMEFPFPSQGWPERLEGKEAIAASMRDYPDRIDLRHFSALRVHQTTAPHASYRDYRPPLAAIEPGAAFAGSTR
jgi:ketosteroid isomerase-like protein